MRKPHVRFVHGRWCHTDIYEQCMAEWHALANNLDEANLERTWALLIKWRTIDAFGFFNLGVACDEHAAFEAILLADTRGDMLDPAYDYAIRATAPRSAL